MGFITNIFTTFLKIIGGDSSTEKKLQLFDVEEYTPPQIIKNVLTVYSKAIPMKKFEETLV